MKAAMKRPEVRSDPVMTRILHARQFALKMIANVTYGYTSAGFTGRMPCCEIADAIVQTVRQPRKSTSVRVCVVASCLRGAARLCHAVCGFVYKQGRSTLEAAVRLVESKPAWDAHVVYGDTDSLFVALPGRSREAAHRIGAEIAAAVTAANPAPMCLKMEKVASVGHAHGCMCDLLRTLHHMQVYLPGLLVSKKRYAGFMYERPDDVRQPAPSVCVRLCVRMPQAMTHAVRNSDEAHFGLQRLRDGATR